MTVIPSSVASYCNHGACFFSHYVLHHFCCNWFGWFQGFECLSSGNPRLCDHIPRLLVLQWAAVCAADSTSDVDLPNSAHCLSESADRLGETDNLFLLFT